MNDFNNNVEKLGKLLKAAFFVFTFDSRCANDKKFKRRWIKVNRHNSKMSNRLWRIRIMKKINSNFYNFNY